MIFLQIPQPDQLLTKATEAGWVAGTLVFLILGGFLSFGWLMRQLYLDQRSLREFQQTILVSLIERTNEVIAQVRDDLAQFAELMKSWNQQRP